jgi:hypothetical protein
MLTMVEHTTTMAGDGPTAEVVSVQPVSLVRIRAVVSNVGPERALIPICGDLDGTDVLCDLATHVEVYGRQRWRPAAQRPGTGVLGGTHLKSSREIEAGGERTFVFQFSRSVYTIKAGVKARLLIDAWRVEDEIRAGSPSMQIETSAFVVPTQNPIKSGAQTLSSPPPPSKRE